MTHRQPTTRPGWWRFFLAAIAAALVALLGATTASAATVTNLETRVGASSLPTAYVVGVHESITAGQRWAKAPPTAETASATGVAAKGGLQVIGEGFSASERAMAQQLASQGRSVVLRQADSAAGRTSDLLLDGVPYDVYTPTTGNLDRIVSSIASKSSQVRGGGVVLDLSKSPLTPDQVGNILPRVQGVTDQISDIIVMGGGG